MQKLVDAFSASATEAGPKYLKESPSVGISEVEVDEDDGEDDPDQAEADHGHVEPDVQLHQLVLDDGPVLRDLLADPDDLVLPVGLDS